MSVIWVVVGLECPMRQEARARDCPALVSQLSTKRPEAQRCNKVYLLNS